MIEKREARDFLQDMLDYSAKAQQLLIGIDFEDFQRNEDKVLAAVKALEVVGEAARQIPPRFVNVIL